MIPRTTNGGHQLWEKKLLKVARRKKSLKQGLRPNREIVHSLLALAAAAVREENWTLHYKD